MTPATSLLCIHYRYISVSVLQCSGVVLSTIGPPVRYLGATIDVADRYVLLVMMQNRLNHHDASN
jgi:hypothetical protein